MTVTTLMSGGIMLPQYMRTSEGTLYEDFENAGTFFVGGSASHAANTSQFKTGAQSIKLTSQVGIQSSLIKTVSYDLSGDWQSLTLWFYLHSSLALYGGSTHIYLSNDTGQTNAWRAWWNNTELLTPGWHQMTWGKAHFKAVGSPSWASAIVRMSFRNQPTAGNVVETSFDSLTIGRRAKPGVMIQFDDGYASQTNQCASVLNARGLRATLYTQLNHIGGAGESTWDELRALYARGWSIANHTDTGSVLTGLSQAAQETRILAGKTELIAQGMPRDVDYMAYPSGVWDDNTLLAMAAQGMKFGRTTAPSHAQGGTPYAPVTCPDDAYPGNLLVRSNSSNGVSAAHLMACVDEAISSGTIMTLHFHNIDGGGGELSLADFTTVMDYIKTKKIGGALVDLTAHDYYKLTQGPWEVPA